MGRLNYSIVLIALALSAPLAALVGDPDILTDYILLANAKPRTITGEFFIHTGFRVAMSINMTMLMPNFMATKGTMMEFPELNG
ncbi:hypothetical protein BAE44_0021230 [Dichanthelium oligosanthes]|uniref:Dirigent protein n=1 Tax=Dichanthelium oligosanthes TaxID=888268 RepID=A0A1E5UXZ8_9POAL|nr:hypothetical protein BAE44_0021230 [Dichanthelium oligosanthes]